CSVTAMASSLGRSCVCACQRHGTRVTQAGVGVIAQLLAHIAAELRRCGGEGDLQPARGGSCLSRGGEDAGEIILAAEAAAMGCAPIPAHGGCELRAAAPAALAILADHVHGLGVVAARRA